MISQRLLSMIVTLSRRVEGTRAYIKMQGEKSTTSPKKHFGKRHPTPEFYDDVVCHADGVHATQSAEDTLAL